jgi:hypothetical protein
MTIDRYTKQELAAIAKQVLGFNIGGTNKLYSLDMSKDEARVILGIKPKGGN